MRIAVLGANTKLGKLVVLEAERHGISVTCIVPSMTDLVGNGPVILSQYKDLNFADLKKFYAIVDVTSFLEIFKYHLDNLPALAISKIIEKENIKLLCVGTKALLYTDKKRDEYLGNTPDIACGSFDSNDRRTVLGFERLKSFDNVNWSVLCPPLNLDEHSYGSGKFEFFDDVLPIALDGKSSITQKDLSLAIIDFLKSGCQSQKVVSVMGVS